jgi:hypothetical protein
VEGVGPGVGGWAGWREFCGDWSRLPPRHASIGSGETAHPPPPPQSRQ